MLEGNCTWGGLSGAAVWAELEKWSDLGEGPWRHPTDVSTANCSTLPMRRARRWPLPGAIPKKSLPCGRGYLFKRKPGFCRTGIHKVMTPEVRLAVLMLREGQAGAGAAGGLCFGGEAKCSMVLG
jgi:hypothetical protein